ncbi:hypothetical protein [Arachnia propionica]|uniref:Uncharacterized protein n=1 Tax=Arachnia propionica TaxID=1750 RepID=A0A3P1WWS2_9ACTN|nr:hypothetical protein [Arachnia propionica]RRD50187.1 hypothetical protein EII35_05445 [Arachnia propionica]
MQLANMVYDASYPIPVAALGKSRCSGKGQVGKMNKIHHHKKSRLASAVVSDPKMDVMRLEFLAKTERFLYNLKRTMRSLSPRSNKEFPSSTQQEAEVIEAEIINDDLDSSSLPEETRAYINRKRREVLEELTGKDYAEMFANAVARNLAEKALATSRLDPRDEDQHLR